MSDEPQERQFICPECGGTTPGEHTQVNPSPKDTTPWRNAFSRTVCSDCGRTIPTSAAVNRSPVKLDKRTTIRWSLAVMGIAVLAYAASALIFGRVRARHHFWDRDRPLTVTVREKPNERSPVDALAWLGFRPGRHTYWAELRSGRQLLATAPKIAGDTYYARQVAVRSADTTSATAFLGNENGEAEFIWRYRP